MVECYATIAVVNRMLPDNDRYSGLGGIMSREGFDGRLLGWLKCGDARAWACLDETYRQRLLRFVHSQLPKGVQSRIEEEDILQEVFTSIFLRVRQGTFHCDTDDRLWQILRIRATKWLRGEIRRHLRIKRDVRHERRICAESADQERRAPEPVDPHAGPQQLAEIHDELLAILDSLDKRSQVLVYLRLQGYTLEELADLTHWSLRTIKRLWAIIRRQCQRRAKSDSDDE